MADSGDEVKLERKKNGSVKKKKKVVDGPPPKAADVAGSKKIRVFKNGDIHHHGVKFVVNTRTTSNMQALLDAVNARIELPYGAKKLYSIAGKAVKSIDDLENGKDYIAASNVFTPLPYGDVKPGEIRWETPGSSFKATPSHSASTVSRSRSTEPIVKVEKKKAVRAKSQAPNKLAAPATETTKSDSDIPLAKKKKLVKKSSIPKSGMNGSGPTGVNGTPKKLVKKESNGEKHVEKKEEKPEKLNGVASPEKKKVLKKKSVIKKKSEANGDGNAHEHVSIMPAAEAATAVVAAGESHLHSAAATHKERPTTDTRNGKRVDIKERRESEASQASRKTHSPARSEHSRHSRSSPRRIIEDDDDSDRDTDRSYNQNSPSSSSSSSSSRRSSSSSSSSSKSSKKSHHNHHHQKAHQEHHGKHGHDHEKKDHHGEHGGHHHQQEKHAHHDGKPHEDHHRQKVHDADVGHHNHHHEHPQHHQKRHRSHSSSSGGSIKSHVSIITRGLPTAHEKRGSYTIERKRTPNGTVHVIHHHSSRHGSPESSRPATRRVESGKKGAEEEGDVESDTATVSSGEEMTDKKRGK